MAEREALVQFRHCDKWAFDFTTKRAWARLVIDLGPWRVIVG